MTANSVNILLIEANPANAEAIKGLFSISGGNGFNLEYVEALPDGLKRLSEGGINAVLLDLSLLGDLSAGTLTHIHRQSPDVPVIVLSGMDDISLALRAMQEGAQDYLIRGQIDGHLLKRVIRDAIGRTQAAAALRVSEEKYRKLFHSANDAIFLIEITPDGRRGKFIEVNDVACRKFGYSREEWLSMTPEDVDDPTEFANTDPQVRKDILIRGHATFEVTRIGKQGQRIPLEINTHLFQLGGKPVILSIARDITERRKMLADLEQSRQRQLESKNRFLSHVSHDLRSPVNAITLYSSILLEEVSGTLNQEQRKELEVILANANRLNTMIGDLLEAARLETAKPVIRFECVSLPEMVEEVVRTLYVTATAKQISVSADIPSDLPPAYADPNRVRQVLVNLLENAIKFTGNNGEVNIRAGVSGEDPGFLALSVSDTGCGIHPENIERIFERLYQEEHAPDGVHRGLGLGLYICKELILRHGGQIWVESQPGQGSTFSFTIPVCRK